MKRYKHESALGEARVGNIEVGLVKDEVSVEQDVEVEGPRPIAHCGVTVAAELALDAEQSGQQRGRREFGFKSGNRVDEARLIRESNRGGGVKRRKAADLSDCLEAPDGSGERGFGWAGRTGNVRAHSDVNGLHGFQSSAKAG